MKKNIHAMLVNAIALTFLGIGLMACSSDESPNLPKKDQPVLPISFDLRTGNMSRAGLETEHKDFQVWGYKEVENEYKPVMERYQVLYDNSKGSWYYNGVNGQNTKYFDKNVDKTYFFACTPYHADNDFITTSRKLGMQTYTAGYEPEMAPMYGSAEVSKSAYGEDVNIQFTRAHAIVGISFIESIPGYKVKILDLGGKGSNTGSSSGIQALPVYWELDDSKDPKEYKHTKSGNEAGYNYKATPHIEFKLSPYNNVLYYNYDTDAKTSDNLVFAIPETVIDDSTPVFSPTKYYAVPSNYPKEGGSTDPTAIESESNYNSSLYFHMSFKLISEDTDHPEPDMYFYNVKVIVTADHTQWLANYAYTYKFEITDSFKGGNPEPVDDADKDYTIEGDPALPKVKFSGVTIEPVVNNAEGADEHSVRVHW